ncbi:DNA-binding protein [Bacteroidia bacterium]|nr:DNA-binding protein [Bacteroidia bacterium]
MKSKQSLTEEECSLLVAYRMQRAKETLAESDNLMKDGFYNAAVNRLYYACYYAVTALLVKNNIVAQTHQGVKQMFSLHFVANNKIDKRYSIFYGRLFNDRMSGDYDDFVQYDNAMLSIIRPQAEEFITVVEKALET